ncbi:MAG: (d)CMP kinase [Pseudomonadota bacterium]
MSCSPLVPPEVRILTIDGPSGAGKGTVARRVAAHFGWQLLDSGALYRLTALAAERAGVALDDVPALVALVGTSDMRFSSTEQGEERVLLNGDEVTADIRTETCGDRASRVAAIPEVREALVAKQRAFAAPPGLVADGRDMGTVIFPEADVKVFLTASAEERAQRRHNQLREKGIGVTFAALCEDIRRRDERDAGRAVAPLKPATDAKTLDTTSLSIDEVVAIIVELVEKSSK